MGGNAEFGVGNQNLYAEKMKVLDYSFPIYFSMDMLGSRIPILLPNYGNLIRPLPPTVWMTVFVMIFVMTLVFMAISKTYAYIDATCYHEEDKRLTKDVFSSADFLIKTFSTITEPELIPWFPQWSAGM